MSMWRNEAMNLIPLHKAFTSMCHKITRDYMYVNVKKYPSHELDTFTPSVYFYVPQDYTRLHVCQCQERCLPTHILVVGYILHIIGRIFLNKTDTNWGMNRTFLLNLSTSYSLFFLRIGILRLWNIIWWLLWHVAVEGCWKMSRNLFACISC